MAQGISSTASKRLASCPPPTKRWPYGALQSVSKLRYTSRQIKLTRFAAEGFLD